MVSGFVFVFFNSVLQWPLGSLSLTIIFSLFVGIYFFGTLIVKHLPRHRDLVVFPRIGPCINCLFTKDFSYFWPFWLLKLNVSSAFLQ